MRTAALAWIPELGVSLSFRLDGLSLLMTLIVTGIGALVLLYAGTYMEGHPRRGALLGYLVAFLAAMLGLVLSDNLLGLFVFWEATSILSYFLIGFDREKAEVRAAALQALLVTGGGGLALLAGFVLLGQAGGSLEISTLVANADALKASPLYTPGAPPRPPRRLHEVGPGAVPLLAPGRHGRADADQRLPPLGDDGEGGGLPPRAPPPGARRDAGVGLDRDDGGRGHDADGGRPRGGPEGPQAPPRLLHGQLARLAHDAHRRRDARGARRGDGLPPRARPLQGGALPRRGDPRPRDGDARRHPPRRPPRPPARDRRRRDRGRLLDGRACRPSSASSARSSSTTRRFAPRRSLSSSSPSRSGRTCSSSPSPSPSGGARSRARGATRRRSPTRRPPRCGSAPSSSVSGASPAASSPGRSRRSSPPRPRPPSATPTA